MFEKSFESVLNEVGFICVSFKGTSMNPMLKEGRDTVCINKYEPLIPLKKGDIALFKRDSGAYVLHRVVKVNNGVYTFCGDNHYVLEEGITDSMILGVMVGYYKNEKYIDLRNSFKYKIYKNTYCKCKLVKKVCKLFIK